jgi:hypothetical protein
VKYGLKRCPKVGKKGSRPTPQIQKTPIYTQIVSPAGPKKVPKMELKNGTKIVRKPAKNGNRFAALQLTKAYDCLPSKCCAKYANGEYRQQDHEKDAVSCESGSPKVRPKSRPGRRYPHRINIEPASLKRIIRHESAPNSPRIRHESAPNSPRIRHESAPNSPRIRHGFATNLPQIRHGFATRET